MSDPAHPRMPAHSRYRAAGTVELPDRTWPDAVIRTAPRWSSTDLRDGNQALIDPMDPARKRRMFDLLVRMGYTEIEVGFPAASQTDYDFVRQLIEDDLIPDDVWICVLTQAREELIERTVHSLAGVPRATIHLYNATAPLFRRVVFGIDAGECRALAERGTLHVMKYAEELLSGRPVGYEYSPEVFVDTELDFALEICEAVTDVWQPAPDRPMIINLPSTVERTTPNVFADQIEWMHRNLSRRDRICLSVHPHNDRGTAVAAAELAVMAGADRVEGCLFGNGERTGNVCLVTLGMNLFSQGVDPGIDFGDIDEIRRTVEFCNQVPVHPRHPYGGDFVYTAFSGSHQDAIKKGFADLEREAVAAGVAPGELSWTIPYLPIDPRDVGRDYQAVVRVNSQSGKGGVAYLMEHEHGLVLPRRLQIEFSRVVQARTDAAGGEVGPEELGEIFEREYLATPHLRLVSHAGAAPVGGRAGLSAEVVLDGSTRRITGWGEGPLSAWIEALGGLGRRVRLLDHAEHARRKVPARTDPAQTNPAETNPAETSPAETNPAETNPAETGPTETSPTETNPAESVAYVECDVDGTILWGVGSAPDILTASLRAVVSAINREWSLTRATRGNHERPRDARS